MKYSKFLLVSIILFIPIFICSSGDSEKITKPVKYKKVFVFFPIHQEIPDFIKNSIFGKRYFDALFFYNKAKEEWTDFEFITNVPEYAQEFVKKGIRDFEKYYEFALNKNYVKKMRLLIHPVFWVFFVAWISCFFYCKKTIPRFCGIISLGAFLYYLFMNLYPCQLIQFWEGKILQNIYKSESSFQDVIFFFKHPLHKKSNRALLIEMHTRQLSAMYCTLKELDRNDLTEIVCPFPIFLNSFSCMSQLYFDSPILIFFHQKFKKLVKKQMKRINCIKLLFQPIQKFKEVSYEYDYSKKANVYSLVNIAKEKFEVLGELTFEQLKTMSLYAVLHIEKPSTSMISQKSDIIAYTIALANKAHFINFQCYEFKQR